MAPTKARNINILLIYSTVKVPKNYNMNIEYKIFNINIDNSIHHYVRIYMLHTYHGDIFVVYIEFCGTSIARIK